MFSVHLITDRVLRATVQYHDNDEVLAEVTAAVAVVPAIEPAPSICLINALTEYDRCFTEFPTDLMCTACLFITKQFNRTLVCVRQCF